jgi:hypothetical protein
MHLIFSLETEQYLLIRLLLSVSREPFLKVPFFHSPQDLFRKFISSELGLCCLTETVFAENIELVFYLKQKVKRNVSVMGTHGKVKYGVLEVGFSFGEENEML